MIYPAKSGLKVAAYLCCLFCFPLWGCGQFDDEEEEARFADARSAPFLDAARKGNLQMVSSLLDNGIDVNVVDGEGVSALVAAAYRGYANIVAVLADSGADLNARYKDGSTALILAAENGHVEVARVLVGMKKPISKNLFKQSGSSMCQNFIWVKTLFY